MANTMQRTLVLWGGLVAACASPADDSRPAATPAPDSQTAGGNAPRPADRFDNPNVAPMPAAGAPALPAPMQNALGCEPGVYLGTYDCDVDLGAGPLPLTGDVSFDLEVGAMPADQAECQEFCVDLTIAAATSTLFGIAGGISFESKLTGGLDCRTGEFRASADKGIYGLGEPIDPSDPNSLWKVSQPAFGTFVGTLGGKYSSATPQSIQGMWNLKDDWTGTTCAGPFAVKLTRL